jgi:tRNA(Arg) A34 adenosine deaminase TadA
MNKEQDQHFIRMAIETGRQGMQANLGGPFGAVIVKDDEIVGRGSNRVTSSNDPTAHAEVVAIREACQELGDFSLKGCILYSSCQPCPMCLGAIYWARLDRLVYAASDEDAAAAGFDDQFIYQELDLQPEERALPIHQILKEEGVQLFREWIAKEDKLEY